jgi:hypothetical protein
MFTHFARRAGAQRAGFHDGESADAVGERRAEGVAASEQVGCVGVERGEGAQERCAPGVGRMGWAGVSGR